MVTPKSPDAREASEPRAFGPSGQLLFATVWVPSPASSCGAARCLGLIRICHDRDASPARGCLSLDKCSKIGGERELGRHFGA